MNGFEHIRRWIRENPNKPIALTSNEERNGYIMFTPNPLIKGECTNLQCGMNKLNRALGEYYNNQKEEQ